MQFAISMLASVILASGIIFSKKAFFKLAKSTFGLLNVMIGKYDDERTQEKLIQEKLPRLIWHLFFFCLVIGISVLLALGCFHLLSTVFTTEPNFSEWDTIVGMVVGGIVPFWVVSLNAKKDLNYSEWAKLLHYLALDNENIGKALFSAEAKRFLNKKSLPKSTFVIVSGLARSGTTALTTQLNASGNFHSLTYSNMPFLLSPRLWSRLHKPKVAKMKERAHGDNTQVGVNSVEALEEYFFKTQTNNSYIKENKIIEHEVQADLYTKYLTYQQLIQNPASEKTLYLAKNNNWITRYRSFRKLNSDFFYIIMFREPLSHAHSLLRQHLNFQKQQQSDSFVLDYMNWLGHYEFGLNHKPFAFSTSLSTETAADTSDVSYWLSRWVEYYQFALKLAPHERTVFINYDNFLADPKGTFNKLELLLDFPLTKPNTFATEPRHFAWDEGSQIQELAVELYEKLKRSSL